MVNRSAGPDLKRFLAGSRLAFRRLLGEWPEATLTRTAHNYPAPGNQSFLELAIETPEAYREDSDTFRC